MEEQGNILKTLLIAAAIYTLARGAPVKRATSSNSVTAACAAANVTKNLCSNTDTTPWDLPTWFNGHYLEADAARALFAELVNHSFNGAVSEAVRKCFNDSVADSQKCALAAAAIKLQDTIKDFFKEYGHSIQIHCNTPRGKVEAEKTLYDASVYIRIILADIDNGHPYGSNCTN